MDIDLNKTVFTPRETDFIRNQLKHAADKGYLAHRTENNPYLLTSFSGVEEKGITPKWNVKIYTYSRKKKGHSLVCVDKLVLSQLLDEAYDRFIAPDQDVLRIDDAGWGFPLCGVMVGVSDEQSVQTDIVSVEYFRDDSPHPFQTKRYLKIYASLAIQLLEQFSASPQRHRIEICTGYVNQPLREELRRNGYDVRVVEIKGLLQDQLEACYKAYVREEIGVDIYYDPKAMPRSEIPKSYSVALKYGVASFLGKKAGVAWI